MLGRRQNKMNKLQKVNELLYHIQKNLSEKLERKKKILEEVMENNEKHLSISITEKDIEYIEGRIYEVDYIIEKLWDIIREEEI